MKESLAEKILNARRVSTPLVFVSTTDPAGVVVSTCKLLNKRFTEEGAPAQLVWDINEGVRGWNERGVRLAEKLCDGDFDPSQDNPKGLCQLLAKPADGNGAVEGLEGAICFMFQADRWIECDQFPQMPQAVWSLRDVLKQDQRMLVMIGSSTDLPLDLQGDIVTFEDTLPAAEELSELVTEQYGYVQDSAGNRVLEDPDDVTLEKAVAAVRGLPRFQCEQAVAMSLSDKGLCMDTLRSLKKAQVNATRGLSVYDGGEDYSMIGGLGSIKKYMTRIMTGRKRPDLILWLDEIEKSGLAHQNDMSGVNADQLGTILSYMEDHRVFGVMLVGVAGSGKSAIAKSTGAEFDTPVLRCDMGSLQGGIVGESQKHMRRMLEVATAVGNDNIMVVATSNFIEHLDSALKSRFADTFFFDLPNAAEREPIWDIWLKSYELDDSQFQSDEGWSPRNIRNCCEKAWRMDTSIVEAAEWVVPAIKSDNTIESVRAHASGKYLSASRPGLYEKPRETQSGKRSKRAVMAS